MSFSAAFAPDVAIITVSDRSDSSRWLHGLDCEHVELGVHGLGRRNVWAARLDEIACSTRRKVILVTESVSCFAVAWWARLSPTAYLADVTGALLLDPLGTGAAAPSLNLKHFSAPSTPLPFPSILYTEAEDAEAGAQAATLATSWGSRFAHASALDLIAGGEGCDSDVERRLALLLADVVRSSVRAPVAKLPAIPATAARQALTR